MKNKGLFKQIMRFAVVGGTCFVVDSGILFVLQKYLEWNYLLASGFSFTVAVLLNYTLSVLWVFTTSKESDRLLEGVVFLVLSVIGLGVNQVVMWFMVEIVFVLPFLENTMRGLFTLAQPLLQLREERDFLPLVAKVFATAVVMVYNFVTRKFYMESEKGIMLMKRLERLIGR